MSERVDIGADIATAINGYLKALRILKRKDCTVEDVASALELPEPIVEKAFREFHITGAALSPNESRSKTVGPFSRVIKLKVRP